MRSQTAIIRVLSHVFCYSFHLFTSILCRNHRNKFDFANRHLVNHCLPPKLPSPVWHAAKNEKKNREPNWNVFQEVFCLFVFICIGCRLSLNQRAEKCASFEAVIIIGQLFLLHSCILADLDFASKPTYVYFYIFWLIYSEFVLILGNWQCSPYCDSCCDTQIAVVSIDLDFL